MKIVIVEDQLFMREAIRYACLEQLGCEVVGEAEHGVAAIQLVCQVKPDLVILDIGLPDFDGFVVATTVLKQLPMIRFLVMSASLDDFTIYRAGKIGVHGFLDKGSNTIDQLSVALEAIAAGQTHYSPSFHAARRALRVNTQSFEKILSSSEQEILALIGEGLSDKEIGLRLGISPTTSQTHRSKILQKLNIKGTPKLIVYAIRNGFAQVPGHASAYSRI